jgi:hypothetical protein
MQLKLYFFIITLQKILAIYPPIKIYTQNYLLNTIFFKKCKAVLCKFANIKIDLTFSITPHPIDTFNMSDTIELVMRDNEYLKRQMDDLKLILRRLNLTKLRCKIAVHIVRDDALEQVHSIAAITKAAISEVNDKLLQLIQNSQRMESRINALGLTYVIPDAIQFLLDHAEFQSYLDVLREYVLQIEQCQIEQRSNAELVQDAWAAAFQQYVDADADYDNVLKSLPLKYM